MNCEVKRKEAGGLHRHRDIMVATADRTGPAGSFSVKNLL